MPIQVPCACGKRYNVADKLAGKRFKCKSCDEVLTVPAAIVEDDEFAFMDADLDDEFAQGTPLAPAPPRRRRAAKTATKPQVQHREPSNWTFGRVGKKIFGVLAILIASIIVLGIIVSIVSGKPPRRVFGGFFAAFGIGSVGFKWLFID